MACGQPYMFGYWVWSISAEPRSLEREDDPLNEFIENYAVFLDSFPLLFFLGKGWKRKGSINTTFIEHLMSYYDGRFQRIQKLMFAIFNQIMRHTVSRKIKSQVMVNCAVNDSLSDMLDSDFNAKLAAAIANPKSLEATSLFNFQKIRRFRVIRSICCKNRSASSRIVWRVVSHICSVTGC